MTMLRLKITGMESLLVRERDNLRDVSPPLARFAPVLAASALANFIAGGRPPWAPLDPAYSRSKTADGYATGILVRTGALMGSIRTVVNGDRVTVGSGVPYASAHQYGITRRNIPPRPFFVLQDEDLRSLGKFVADYITGAA